MSGLLLTQARVSRIMRNVELGGATLFAMHFLKKAEA